MVLFKKTEMNDDPSSARGQYEQPITIGAQLRPSGPTDLCSGSIDDVRIYNRALTEEQVKALYDLEKPME
jgi:hypothetical protein